MSIDPPTDSASGANPAETDRRARTLRACRASLDELLDPSAAIRFASLSLIDGRPVLAAGYYATSAERVAAIASSLLALSEAVSREATSSRVQHTTITADDGLLVVVRVPSRKPVFALSAGCGRSGNLAMLLRRTLDCAQSIAQIIDGAPA